MQKFARPHSVFQKVRILFFYNSLVFAGLFAFTLLNCKLYGVEKQVEFTEIKDELPTRKTKYMIRVPKEWNGTLINDLDFRKSADSARNLYLLNHGYALSGTERRTDRFENYDPAHECHDFISIFDIFESKFGKPKRTLQIGCSGGGTVTLSMAEIHSDRIDGAIAACAATSPWMANTHLDCLFVLKVLLAPDLAIVNLGSLDGDELKELGAAWEKVIHESQETPEGRARIALAITIGQWPAWGARGKAPVPKPDPNDVRALQESMYQSLSRLIPNERTIGPTMLELAGRGQLRWNTGIDYGALFQNGNADYIKAVESLYKDAPADLKSDLEKINVFPRIAADASAIKYWSSPGRTHLGTPKVPLFRMHTIGDGLVYSSMAQGYEDLVKKNGYSQLFRSAYVDCWGHCTFSLAEWLAAIKTVEQRIDTGKWPSTTPDALNKRCLSIDLKDKARFFEFNGVQKYNRTWVPSVNDYVGGVNE